VATKGKKNKKPTIKISRRPDSVTVGEDLAALSRAGTASAWPPLMMPARDAARNGRRRRNKKLDTIY
jgi:hypothetical protein